MKTGIVTRRDSAGIGMIMEALGVADEPFVRQALRSIERPASHMAPLPDRSDLPGIAAELEEIHHCALNLSEYDRRLVKLAAETLRQIHAKAPHRRKLPGPKRYRAEGSRGR